MSNAVYCYNPENGTDLIQVESVIKYERFDVLITNNMQESIGQGWYETPLQAKQAKTEIDAVDEPDAVDNFNQRKRGRPRNE